MSTAMGDNSLRLLKFDGTGKVNFGRWKTKMLAIASIKGEFDQAYLTQLPTVVDLTVTPPITAAIVQGNQKKI
ncbi:MAG TPA: hypothetical protein V6D48_00975 [Oculatellaceae cyanobacterium]